MSALTPDYDSDPARWASDDSSTRPFGNVHERVAALVTAEGAAPTIDVGGGQGRLATRLPRAWPAVLVDNSPTQLARADARARKLRAEATRLPVADGSAGSVAMLWMLYHLSHPGTALEEARRALRPGGLLLASTASRRNDPELTDGYPPTSFDAEEAGEIVSSVFGEVTVESWDAPLAYLVDGDAVVRYCRSHLLPASAAERVSPPLWLTKRGCLVIARR
jgi:SAM-dependent methyltransferase